MSVLVSSIQDNYKRNIANQEFYCLKLDSLPKGKIVLRKKGNKKYYYLEYRDGNKVIYKYLGPIDKYKIDNLQKELEERIIYERRLKTLKEEEKEMVKVLKVLGLSNER